MTKTLMNSSLAEAPCGKNHDEELCQTSAFYEKSRAYPFRDQWKTNLKWTIG